MLLLEERLTSEIGPLGDVDGHDVGARQMNIFILTDDPKAAFEHIRHLIDASIFANSYAAAYRPVAGEDYAVLHPPGVRVFKVT